VDQVPVDQVQRYEAELLRHLRGEQGALLKDIRERKDISKDGADGMKIEDKIKSVLTQFGKTFVA
jgi:F-type H+-transporting ATPase subunit alpha